MKSRSPALQSYLDCLAEAFAASRCAPEVSDVTARLFAALEEPAMAANEKCARLPVCQFVPEAISLARSSSIELARLASTFDALEPSLIWRRRASGGPNASANWFDGHANAMIVGPEGSIERRHDVAIGASLLAPLVRYPDHRHTPEEAYLLLTPGRFRHGDGDWCEPGAGGTFHNVPNIEHAMASGEAPLLAFWCLLLN